MKKNLIDRIRETGSPLCMLMAGYEDKTGHLFLEIAEQEIKLWKEQQKNEPTPLELLQKGYSQ